MKDVQGEHMKDRGFADISYHYGIDLKGNIYMGRPLWKQGASVGQADKQGVIGIVILGDMQNNKWNDWNNDKLTPEAAQTLIKLVNYLSVKYEIQQVGGHTEINCDHTGYLGNQVIEILPDVRKAAGAKQPACLTNGK